MVCIIDYHIDIDVYFHMWPIWLVGVTHGRSLASKRSEHPSDADADDADDGEQSEEMDSWPRGFFGSCQREP